MRAFTPARASCRPSLRPSGSALLCCALLASLAATACRDGSAPPLRVVVGPAPGDQLDLVPRSSLAEYIEISPTERALLLTFSSGERSCDAVPAPADDSASVAIRLVLPGAAELAPGSYPILPAGQDAAQPHSLLTVKLHGRRSELRPGGDLQLRELDLSPRGFVAGLLRYEFPGDAQHPATRVSGRFSAHFCRISRLR